jgi:transposase
VVLTGANRHDKVAAIDLMVSVALKRPAHKEQHLCADQAYDASEVREFASSEGGYTTHIKVNPRKKDSTELSDQSSQERDSHGEPHPARRWVVERTIAWIDQQRRMSKDYERMCASGEAFVYAAMIRLMTRRLARV